MNNPTSNPVEQFTACGPASIPAFVPAEIASLDQFVVWRSVLRTPKPAKQPYNPYTGYPASVTRPADWSDLGTAQAVAHTECYDGLGFVFTADDPFAGVDLDCCRDPRTGALESWAADLVGDFDSNTEVSPSGTGVKLFLRGAVPSGGRRHGPIECYSANRFFTLTGQRLDGVTTEIRPAQQALDKLLARFPQHQPVLSNAATAAGFAPCESTVLCDEKALAAILQQARNAGNGDRFCQLYDHGDTSEFNGDHSTADWQLVLYLAYWTNGDLAAMDALFRGSALFRADKWDSKRGNTTYGGMTLQKAAASRGRRR